MIGIVASRIKDKFNKPVIIISLDDNGIGKAKFVSIDDKGIGKASARSIEVLILVQ